MKVYRVLFTVVVILTLSAATFAEAEVTGTLRGVVRSADGSPLVGVRVTATSPSLQGSRSTTTSDSGHWILRGLAPGEYTVTIDGTIPVRCRGVLPLGREIPLRVTLPDSGPGGLLDGCWGRATSGLAGSEVSTSYDFELVNRLPIGREPDDVAALAPGLSTNTPNGGQVTISGGFGYDNVFLIDGGDTNDNLFGTANPVYIEDAIAETQVLTSGISAQYGRFSGGVVNVITKSGGNELSGTLRVDLTNEDWREETPLEEDGGATLEDEVDEVYSATLGGYLLRDRLWFFLAGRDTEDSDETRLFKTDLPASQKIDAERFQGKLTFNIANRHQIQGSYTDREQTGVRPSFGFSATPSTLRTRKDPAELLVARYSGVLTPALFAELQYSEKSFTFMNIHGLDASTTPSTDPSFVENTPFFDFLGNFSGHYHAPYFDGKDPEDRNNEQLAGSLSFFLDGAAGSHNLRVGVEDYSSFRTGGNSQTPTDWVISALPTTDAAGNLSLDANGELTPSWQPGASGAWQFLANRDAEVEIQTRSAYVNDRWQLNDHWSFNLGFRYEEVEGETRSGMTTVDADAFVPRLGASYDLRGDGKYRFDATYAQYAGKYSESQFAENTDIGNPPGLFYLYVGPAGTGYNFAPGYDIANNYIPLLADDGTQNVVVDEGITSPTVEEFTLSAGVAFDRGGFLKAIYTNREYDDFVEDFVTTETGSTEVIVEGISAGVFSNTFITNSDLPVREYEAIQLIGRCRLTDDWTLDGNYTYQVKNDGNFEGEGTNTPGVSTVIGDYPEIRTMGQHFPVGPLNDFQEHRLRLWSTYNLDLGRAGTLDFGLLMNFDSGRVFSTTTSFPITAEQQAILAANGYVDQPSSQTVYFGRRGDIEFDDSLTFDLAVNYQLPIWSGLRLWIKADVVNLFDDDTQVGGNSTAGDLGGFDALGLPTTFGSVNTDARNNADFVDPREYRFTVGFRF